MLHSMTGYGSAQSDTDWGSLFIELRSVNGRQFDINSLRLPNRYRGVEMEMRRQLQEKLVRGKITCSVTLIPTSDTIGKGGKQLDWTTLSHYYSQLTKAVERLVQGSKGESRGNTISTTQESKTVAKSANPDDPGLFLIPIQTALKQADIWIEDEQLASEEEEKICFRTLERAIEQCIQHREQEGSATQVDLENSLIQIGEQIKIIEDLAGARIRNVEKRLRSDLQNLKRQNLELEIDEGRFAQELIYYIEKLDINEELQRLQQHCNYFTQTMEGEAGQGKKLGFILQEMNREANTIGSKANQVEIQHAIVRIKDQIERMKEQISNIL